MSEIMTESTGSPAELIRTGAASGVWDLDLAASTAAFAVKLLWGLMTVRGRLERFEGQAEVTADGEVSASLTFDAATVQTGIARRDRHLRARDFFYVEEHPTIAFVTRRVGLVGDRRAAIEGDLTVAGRRAAGEGHDTRAVADRAASRVVVEATLTVDRTQFGMTLNPLGMAASAVTLTVRLV